MPGYSAPMAAPADLEHAASTSKGMNRRNEPACRHGVEQDARLLRGSAAQLHQGVRTRGRRLGSVGAEDLGFGARRVVLGKPGDLIEEIAARGS